MARKRKLAVPPTCNCIILCDDIVQSITKGKLSLVGLIGTIVVPELPAIIGGYGVYVRGSNVHGDQKIRLVIETDDGDEVLGLDAGFTKDTNPLAEYTLVTRLPPFRIEQAGKYLFSAKHNGVPIAQMQLMIAQIPAPGEQS